MKKAIQKNKMQRNIPYDDIYQLYLLKDKNKKIIPSLNLHNIRQRLITLYDEDYHGRNWNDLSPLEKDMFKYIKIRNYLKKQHTDPAMQNQVDAIIDRQLSTTLLKADETIKDRNDAVRNSFKNYKHHTNAYEAKWEQYEKVCKYIREYNPLVPIPSYDEWYPVQLRAYDYIKSFENSTVDITPIILRIILQVLEEKLGLKINYYTILNTLSDFDTLYKKGTTKETDDTEEGDVEKEDEKSKKERESQELKEIIKAVENIDRTKPAIKPDAIQATEDADANDSNLEGLSIGDFDDFDEFPESYGAFLKMCINNYNEIAPTEGHNKMNMANYDKSLFLTEEQYNQLRESRSKELKYKKMFQELTDFYTIGKEKY